MCIRDSSSPVLQLPVEVLSNEHESDHFIVLEGLVLVVRVVSFAQTDSRVVELQHVPPQEQEHHVGEEDVEHLGIHLDAADRLRAHEPDVAQDSRTVEHSVDQHEIEQNEMEVSCDVQDLDELGVDIRNVAVDEVSLQLGDVETEEDLHEEGSEVDPEFESERFENVSDHPVLRDLALVPVFHDLQLLDLFEVVFAVWENLAD